MIKKLVLSMTVIVCTGMLAAATALSENTFPPDEETMPAAGSRLHKDMLILDDVGDDYATFCNRIYEVNARTTIRNERGTAITLASLPIPCEALVSYYRKKGEHHKYVAVSIEVRGEARPVPE